MGSGDPPGLQNRCAAGLPVVVRFNPETLPPNCLTKPGVTLQPDRFAAVIRECRSQAGSSSMIVHVTLAWCSAHLAKKRKAPQRRDLAGFSMAGLLTSPSVAVVARLVALLIGLPVPLLVLLPRSEVGLVAIGRELVPAIMCRPE